MKWKKKLIAGITVFALSFPSIGGILNKGLKYTSNTSSTIYKGRTYSAVKCSSLEEKVDGWCIEDDQHTFVTDKYIYSDLALMFEVDKDYNFFESDIIKSKEVFDKAFNIQLGIDLLSGVVNVGSQIEGPLIMAAATGGASLPTLAQTEIVKNAFDEKQKEVYSMYMDKIKIFSEDLMNKKISEEELKLRLKNSFGECYEYQLKLASAELEKSRRMMKKQNKTKYDYSLIWKNMINGISRGYMAATYLNIINESNMFDNSAKKIIYNINKGFNTDFFLNLDFLVEDPDLERATKEAQKKFNNFYSPLSQNDTYWDVSDPKSNASRILPLIINAQKRRDKIKEKKEEIKKPEVKKEEPKKEIPKLSLNLDRYPKSDKFLAIIFGCEGYNAGYKYLNNQTEGINWNRSNNKLSIMNKGSDNVDFNYDPNNIINEEQAVQELYRLNNLCTQENLKPIYHIFEGNINSDGALSNVRLLLQDESSLPNLIRDINKIVNINAQPASQQNINTEKKEPLNIESKNEKVILRVDIDCSGYIGGGKYTYTNSGDGRGWCGGKGGNGHCLSNREDIVFDLRTSSCNMSGYYISANGKHIIVGDNNFSNLIYALKQAERGEYVK